MLLVCVSALGFILVLLLLDKASDLVNHIGHHLYHPVYGGAGRRRYGHQAHRVPLTIRKATGDRFIPAPLPPPKELSSSGFWFLEVKSLPPEAKPTVSLRWE